MSDFNVRWRNEHRLGVRQHVKTILAVVMAHAGRAHAAKRHGLDEKVDIDLVHRAATKGKLFAKAIDTLLLAAENKCGQGKRRSGNPSKRFIKRFVGEDWQDWPENLVLHDFIIPGNWIKQRRVEVVRFRV